MKIIRKIEKKFMKTLNKIVSKYNYRQMSDFIKRKTTDSFKELKHHRKLTKEQEKEVDDFYMGLIGKKLPHYGHEYSLSRNGVFSKECLPEDFYVLELRPRANVYKFQEAYDDKNVYDLILAGENIAHTVLKNMNGYYYYEGDLVSEKEAIARCHDFGQGVIKPSMKLQGQGVNVITIKEGKIVEDGRTVQELFDDYGRNFLIQQCVKQHKDMAALNPTSVNTIRVLTYHSGMEVIVVFCVLKIGRKNQVIDNQCAGGISVAVSEDGKVGKMAYGGYTEDDVMQTDSGIVLEGYQLPSFEKVKEMAKRLHRKLPYFDIVGWDIAIEENGEPILIEYNTNTGLYPSCLGTSFGKYTERIISELWPRPNTRFKGYS